VIGARRDYERWLIRCCSLDDFAGWWAHAREVAAMLLPPSKTIYCGDADPAWCAEQQQAGLCTAGLLEPKPKPTPIARHGQRVLAAAEWLRQYLGDGPRLSTELHRAATAAGISSAALYKAASLLEVHREPAKLAVNGYIRYYWSLPFES